jgi:hypothetical protein
MKLSNPSRAGRPRPRWPRWRTGGAPGSGRRPRSSFGRAAAGHRGRRLAGPAVPAPAGPTREHLLYTAAGGPVGRRMCGLVLDDWPEVVPTREHTRAGVRDRRAGLRTAAGLAAGHPGELGRRLERGRPAGRPARPPGHGQGAGRGAGTAGRERYAQFLPATVAPVHPYPISIMLGLAGNNALFDKLREP